MLREKTMLRERFQYHPPWTIHDWWKPSWFRGCDEWHNKSYSVVVPFLGWFVLFVGPFSRHGPEHLYASGPKGPEGRIVTGCQICEEIVAEFEIW